jgi:hypothetical protein
MHYAHDSQILVVLTLVVSKVLDRYLQAAKAAPARQGPVSLRIPRSSSGYGQNVFYRPDMGNSDVHGEDRIRSAGQLVLGEFHRA